MSVRTQRRLGWLTGGLLALLPLLLASPALFGEVRWRTGTSAHAMPTPTPTPPLNTETFYVRAAGPGSAPETPAGAWDAADFNTAGNWTTDEGLDDGLIGPGDTVVVLADDGALTELIPQGSGTEDAPITIKRGSQAPIVDGGTSTDACPTGGETTTKLNGLVAYWDFEESSAGVGAVPRNDATPCGHDLQDPYFVASTTNHQLGARAARFTYQPGINDNFELDDSESISVFGANESYTIAAWINILQGPPAGSPSGSKLIAKVSTSPTREFALEYQYCPDGCPGHETSVDHIHFLTFDGVGLGGAVDVPVSAFNPSDHFNEWHFYVLTNDAVNRTRSIQIDNGTVYSNSTAGLVDTNTNAPLKIGGLGNAGVGTGGSADAIIDDTEIWTRLLTTTEKTSVFEDGLTGGPSAPAATANALLISGKSWLTIDGIKFRGGNGGTSGVGLVTGAGSDNITIENCEFGYSTQHGLLIAPSAGHNITLSGNSIHDNAKDGISSAAHVGSTSVATQTLVSDNTITANGQNGILAYGNYWSIEHNAVDGNGGAGDFDGIHIYGGATDDGTGDNNLVAYNIVTNQTGTGEHGAGIFFDRFGATNTAYYNVTHSNAGPGIALNDAPSTVLYNNSMDANMTAGLATLKAELVIASTATDSTTVIAKNNLAFATAASTFAVLIDAQVSNNLAAGAITNNDWYRTSGNWYSFNGTAGATLATWNALDAGIGTDINADPLFTSAPTDLDLLIGSPCIEAGLAVGLGFDFEGETIQGLPDCGAYEGPPTVPALIKTGAGEKSKGHLGTPNGRQFDTCHVLWTDAHEAGCVGASCQDAGGNPTTRAGFSACNADTDNSAGGVCEGTFRQCVFPSTSRKRPRLVKFDVGGDISINACDPNADPTSQNYCPVDAHPPWAICPAGTLGAIQIKQPYLTIDGMDTPSPGINLKKVNRGVQFKDCGPGQPMIQGGMTHDIIITGVSMEGHFIPYSDGANQEVTLFIMDGDSDEPICSTWDDKPECPTCAVGNCSQCGGGGQPLCTGPRSWIIDHVTEAHGSDEAGATFDDVKFITRQHMLFFQNWHPAGLSSASIGGSPNAQHSRNHITDWGNVCVQNNERCFTKLTKGAFNYTAINNFEVDWRDYGWWADQSVGATGFHNDGGFNFYSNLLGNVFMPGTDGGRCGTPGDSPRCTVSNQLAPTWDCFEAGSPNANLNCSPTNQAYCNMYAAQNVFFTGHNMTHCAPKGLPAPTAPYSRPYSLPSVIDPRDPANEAAICALINEAGAPYKTAEQQAALDEACVSWLARAVRCQATGAGCQGGVTQ